MCLQGRRAAMLATIQNKIQTALGKKAVAPEEGGSTTPGSAKGSEVNGEGPTGAGEIGNKSTATIVHK